MSFAILLFLKKYPNAFKHLKIRFKINQFDINFLKGKERKSEVRGDIDDKESLCKTFVSIFWTALSFPESSSLHSMDLKGGSWDIWKRKGSSSYFVLHTHDADLLTHLDRKQQLSLQLFYLPLGPPSVSPTPGGVVSLVIKGPCVWMMFAFVFIAAVTNKKISSLNNFLFYSSVG